MSTCTFFGHRDCPNEIKSKLRTIIVDLITDHNVTTFYVGNQGQFDAIVRSVLRELKEDDAKINYAVVLAICLTRKRNTTITLTPCSRKESSPSIYAMPSPGAKNG